MPITVEDPNEMSFLSKAEKEFNESVDGFFGSLFGSEEKETVKTDTGKTSQKEEKPKTETKKETKPEKPKKKETKPVEEKKEEKKKDDTKEPKDSKDE